MSPKPDGPRVPWAQVNLSKDFTGRSGIASHGSRRPDSTGFKRFRPCRSYVPTRVGLIGAGVMGRNHARVIHEVGAELAGVADPERDAAGRLARRFRVPNHSDYSRLLRDPTVDAVVVAVPTRSHYAIVRAALEAGKHVLVEKPIAQDLRQARDLIRVARRKGLVLAVGHVERHNPVVRWARQALRRRDVGAAISFTSRRLSPFPDRVRDVGAILDLGIHDLDIIRFLAGRGPRGVYALAGSHRPRLKVEDHASILLDFQNGVQAHAEVSWLIPTKVRTLFITCAGGVVELDYRAQEVVVSRGRYGRIDPDNLFQVPVEYATQRVSLEKEEPLQNEHRDFYRAIRLGRRPLADGRDGLAALALALASLQSARTGRRVAAPPEAA